MASTYLHRDCTSAGSSTTVTLSAWVKRGKAGTRHVVFAGWQSSTERMVCGFESNNHLQMQIFSGGTAHDIETNRKFYDSGAWYHLVFQFNTSSGTEADRFKMFVNGVQETSFAVDDTIGQNAPVKMFDNTNCTSIIGARKNSSFEHYFDGDMSHVHIIDGTVYAPSVFGEVDATSGIWVAKTSPSVTYGTNGGFYKFASGASGTDSSGNSNTMTVAGTLTNIKDTPDNNFATWDCNVPITNSNYGMSFTNGNRSVIPTSPDANGSRNYATSTLSMPTKGKYYAEFKLISNDNVAMIGILAADQVNYNFINNAGTGSTTETMVYALAEGTIKYNGGNVASSMTAVTNGNILGLAIDMDNQKFYAYVNGTLQNSSGETFASRITGNNVVFNCGDNTASGYDKIEANFGQGYFGTTAVATNSGAGYAGADGKSKFNYQPRANHVALSTIGLNT